MTDQNLPAKKPGSKQRSKKRATKQRRGFPSLVINSQEQPKPQAKATTKGRKNR